MFLAITVPEQTPTHTTIIITPRQAIRMDTDTTKVIINQPKVTLIITILPVLMTPATRLKKVITTVYEVINH